MSHMSFATIAIVNLILAIGIVSALAYVCRLPFRLESASPSQPGASRLYRILARSGSNPG